MEIKDFLSLMWRSALILIAGLFLGGLLGFVISRIQTPIYEASTEILISRARQQSNTDMLPLGEDQLVSTNVRLAKSQPVLDAASAQLGSKIMAANLQVNAISNTLIVQIKVQDTDSQRATAIANILVQVLIKQNEELVSARYATFETSLKTQIDQIQKQINDLQTQINQINDTSISEQLAQANQEIDRLNSEVTALENEINNYPAILNDKQRTALSLQQAQLEQLRTKLNLYQQIQTNLIFIGKPGQSGVSRNDPRLNSLQSTLDLYQQLYLSLVDSRETINLDRVQNTPNITQINPATPPKAPVRPLPLLYILLGCVVGLGLSVTLILTIDHLDDTLKSSQKVQEVLGVPIIGQISEAHYTNHKHAGSSLAAGDISVLLNAYGSLRINVSRLMLQQSVKVLLITSPSRGDGKTMIAENLASAFATSGRKVILIDADLYHPQLHARLKLDDQAGLTSILADGLNWKEVAQKSGRMTVISSGPRSSSSAVLLESDAMTRLLDDLQTNSDVVIIDGPPLFIMDAQVLASKVGGILLIVRQSDTLTAVARAMLDQLNFMEANVFGAVLNCVPQKQNYYFDERIEHLGKNQGKSQSARVLPNVQLKETLSDSTENLNSDFDGSPHVSQNQGDNHH
jgi:succinoglycan biosynthesis transport protein ExoP